MTASRSSNWQEIYDGGSPEAEHEIFMSLAQDILKVQELNRQKAGCIHAMRTLHAKIVFGVKDARLVVDRDLPKRFHVAHFLPGASLPTAVRLSNASGIVQSDSVPDMRGAALRVKLPSGLIHDLLMTSFPVSHARNARQFVAFAIIASGDRSQMLSRMAEAFGKEEAARMLGNIGQAVRPSTSLATDRYWSRGAILWGAAGPVRYNMRPTDDSSPASAIQNDGPNNLRTEFEARLQKDDVKFRVALQSFVDEDRTPIEDGATEWTEQISPSVDIATLIIPQQNPRTAKALVLAQIDEMAFNPWNAPDEFRPLGNLNRARKVIYAASAEKWLTTNR